MTQQEAIDVINDVFKRKCNKPRWKRNLSSFIFFSANAKIMFGLWLLAPMWDSFTHTSAFGSMAYYGSEDEWGCAIILLGILQNAGLWLAHPKSKATVILPFLSLFVWALLSFLIGQANISSTGVAIYATIALHDFVNAVFEGQNE